MLDLIRMLLSNGDGLGGRERSLAVAAELVHAYPSRALRRELVARARLEGIEPRVLECLREAKRLGRVR